MMKVGNAADNDVDGEDIVMVATHDKEADFMCPYTRTLIDIPMKNESCKHIVSKLGLDMMLKKKLTVGCPIAGCVAKWTLKKSSIDTAFQKRMLRFKRVQEETGASELSQQHVVSEVLDDEEYTQI